MANPNALAAMITTLAAQAQAQNIPIDPNVLLQLATAASQPQQYAYGQQQPNIAAILSLLGNQAPASTAQPYTNQQQYPPAQPYAAPGTSYQPQQGFNPGYQTQFRPSGYPATTFGTESGNIANMLTQLNANANILENIRQAKGPR